MTANILSADPTGGDKAFFRWYGAKDTDAKATPSLKARSFLGANCSHCHGNNASVEGASHDFDFLTNANRVADSTWSGFYVGKASYAKEEYPQPIYKGEPSKSYILLRLMARGTLGAPSGDQMPPLATFQMDSASVFAVKDSDSAHWAASPPARPASFPPCRPIPATGRT